MIKKEVLNLEIKFMWNGIKADGKLYKAWYNKSSLINYPKDVITIYAKEYKSFPKVKGLTIENDSDLMTDYHEKDRIRVTPDNPYYEKVLEAYQKQEKHHQKMNERRNRKNKAGA